MSQTARERLKRQGGNVRIQVNAEAHWIAERDYRIHENAIPFSPYAAELTAGLPDVWENYLDAGRSLYPDFVDYPEEDYYGERCSHPNGHEFHRTGTAFGGDDERWGGEGRCYCSYCGADGDM